MKFLTTSLLLAALVAVFSNVALAAKGPVITSKVSIDMYRGAAWRIAAVQAGRGRIAS